jgi:predicted kinase
MAPWCEQGILQMAMPGQPLLVVFCGLPGTGKTSLAKRLAARLDAAYLRIDEIEQAMKRAGMREIGAAGYGVAMALARSNLDLGRPVVADGVNPVQESRAGWREVAARAQARLVDVMLVCSDEATHRQRVEARRADIPGLIAPGWDSVLAHEFEPRHDAHLVLDSARMTPDQLAERCLAYISAGA